MGQQESSPNLSKHIPPLQIDKILQERLSHRSQIGVDSYSRPSESHTKPQYLINNNDLKESEIFKNDAHNKSRVTSNSLNLLNPDVGGLR